MKHILRPDYPEFCCPEDIIQTLQSLRNNIYISPKTKVILKSEMFSLIAKYRPGWIKDTRRTLSKHYQAFYDILIERDGEKCVYCGSTSRLEIDHIKPVSKGGTLSFENLQLLCKSCNCKKSDHWNEEIWV